MDTEKTAPPIDPADYLPRERLPILDSEMSHVDVGNGDPVVFPQGNPTWSHLWQNIIPYMALFRRYLAAGLKSARDQGRGRPFRPRERAARDRYPWRTLRFPASRSRLMLDLAGFEWIPHGRGAADRATRAWVLVLRRWLANQHARRALWRCASLDPRFAKDIGLTLSEIAWECRAPFWVAITRPHNDTRARSCRGERTDNERPLLAKPQCLNVENRVMLDATTIVSNYVAVWNEADPRQRRRRIEAVWVPDGASCYRLLEAHGYDAIERRVAGSWDKWLRDRRYVFRPKTSVCHHDVVKSAWEMVAVPDGEVEAKGLSFLILDPDGRIRHDYQFNPSLNDANTLADRHHAAVSEPDALHRRRLIAELWAPDGAYVSEGSASRSFAEIDAAIAVLQTDRAAQGLVLASPVKSQAHHRIAWFQSPLRLKEAGRAAATVSHLLILDEGGRIQVNYQFQEPV